MNDKEKLKKIKIFCQKILDDYSSSFDQNSSIYDDDDTNNDFFCWTDFNKIINIIDGEKNED